jgi:hypothetical protein
MKMIAINDIEVIDNAPNEKAGAAVATNPPDVDDEGPPNLKKSLEYLLNLKVNMD